MFNLFVLTVNLNLYCSWKTLRFEQIVCVVCAWSPWIMVIAAFAQNGYKLWQKNHFQHKWSVFGLRLPRGQSKFWNENYATVWWKSKPFLPDFPWVLTEVYRFSLKFIGITFVWHELQKGSISIMPSAPDARGDSFKELILTFYSPKRILQSIRSLRLNSLSAIILPI